VSTSLLVCLMWLDSSKDLGTQLLVIDRILN